MDIALIRNFAIIAHIDHGKSTFADRLIEYCGGLAEREMQSQVLDSMELERERGITIKAQTVRLLYRKESKVFCLNLIDTPGHVDFAYEVSRSLAACEGSLLLVDSSQGVEAQTLANAYLAVENDHKIIPILNKIDLPSSEPERVQKEIEEVIGIDTQNIVLTSAKTGAGIKEVLDSIINFLPNPEGDLQKPLKALLVDSWYDEYLGVVVLVRVKDGILRKGLKIYMMASNASYTIDSVGVFTPKKEMVEELCAGEVGFITANIKKIPDCYIGDTITEDKRRCNTALPGFKKMQSVVFCSLFPADSGDFENLRDALLKLSLNDSSFEYDVENSVALGHGFRCGFLGLLHLEIVQGRLEREFDLDLITTAPSVVYKMYMRNKEIIELHSPADMPDIMQIEFFEEPWVLATILVPGNYLGAILNLCTERRGEQVRLDHAGDRSMAVYKLPLAEIVFDFYDRIKSISCGYASFDWELADYLQADIVKLSILVNSEPVDALSCMVHKSFAEQRGRALCKRLKDLIPQQLYKVAIQAAISGKIIARETISALRKDVTAKCYGGDITRKKKLLEKQKKGKKRMRTFGNVNIPKNAFIDALKIDYDK